MNDFPRPGLHGLLSVSALLLSNARPHTVTNFNLFQHALRDYLKSYLFISLMLFQGLMVTASPPCFAVGSGP